MEGDKIAMNRLRVVSSHVAASQTTWVMKNITPLEFYPKGNLKGKTLFISGASRGNLNRIILEIVVLFS